MYKIQLYPFDTQVIPLTNYFNTLNAQTCNIHLTLAEFDKDTVELVPDKVFIPDKIDIPQYVLDQSGVTLNFLKYGEYTDQSYN